MAAFSSTNRHVLRLALAIAPVVLPGVGCGGDAIRSYEVPATPRPNETRPAGDVNARPQLAYDTPEGWVEDAPTAFRLANLRTSDDADAATVTVFAFPAAGAMGDLLANVNRWRNEIGLPPTDRATLDGEAEAITLGGAEGMYVEMINRDQATYTAMATRGPMVWFFKLTGNTATADAQRDAFRAWIDSVRFDGDDAPDRSPDGAPEQEDG